MLEWSAYESVADALALQGFNVIPLPPQAKGSGGSGVTFKHLNKPDSRRVTEYDRQQWRTTFRRKDFSGVVGGYLLPNSGERWYYAIVDVDDPEYFPRVRRDFPETPLYVERGSRVRHMYYRTNNPRRAHCLGLYGKRSVDVIATTGVVLPGSHHADGDLYALSIPFEQWTDAWVQANVPELPLDVIDAQRSERRVVLHHDLAKSDPPISASEGFMHASTPRELGDSVWCGSVLPGTLIDTIDGPKPLREISSGTKCFATYRPDSSPSAHVSDHRGRRHFWDMSTSPRRYWTMIDEESDDPELLIQAGDYTAQLQQALETRLGVEVIVLQDQGYIDAQIPELPDNSTTFIIAPHGTGKTVLSRREHARASSCISVCNTQALTVANAAVLGLTAVYEEIADKASVCIPSLRRYESPPEFFHVDEADAVHGFLHSGKVEEPLQAWRTMMHFASRSRRSLFASADLSFEDIALFVKAIRARNATRSFRVYIRVPGRGVSVKLCSLAKVKSEIHKTIKNPSDAPLFVGITTRKLAGQIAQGYRSANALKTVDLAEVADAIDSPSPGPVELEIEDEAEGAGVESSFWVSGENSRFAQAVNWLGDTDRLVRSHALLVTSPAVQSGVSLNPPVSRVLVLHGNREVPASAVLQIVRRARNPVDRTVLIGLPAWAPQTHRTDRAYLDDLVERRAKTTIHAIAEHFPTLTDEHSLQPDSEFAHSWRVTVRRMIRSYSDPVGALREAAARHGIACVDDTSEPDEGARRSFHYVTEAAKRFRENTNAKQTAEAEEIDFTELERLEKASRLESGERQKLDRAEIARFYELDVTPELVRLDNAGKYRTKVRDYTHVVMVRESEEIVAYLDHRRGKGRQPSQRPHNLARAWIMADLLEFVLAGELEFAVQAARPLVIVWWKKYHFRARTFFPRLKGPAPEYEIRWFCDRLRALGAQIKTVGENLNRRKLISFEQVDAHSLAYAERLFAMYEQREGEEWRKQWSTSPG